MKNNLIFIYIAIVLFLFGQVIIFYKSKKIETELFKTKEILKSKEQNISYLSKNFEDKISSVLMYLEIDNLELDNFKLVQSYLINDAEDDFQEITQIINSDKIIFRFFQTSCSSCITQELDRLQMFSKKVPTSGIILLTDYLNKDIRWYLINNRINFKVYETREADLGVSFDKNQIPYIFLCGPNLKIELPYILTSKTMEYSEHFYRSAAIKFM